MSTLNVENISVTGAVNLPSFTTSNLPPNQQGLLVYNTTKNTLDINNGTSWIGGSGGAPNGLTAATAATSAAQLKIDYPSYPSGVYWIRINNSPTRVYCEMSIDSGGWMLGMNINTSDGHVVQYGNDDFWTSPWRISDKPGLGASSDPEKAFVNDFKAIIGGNLWKNFSGTKLLIVVHESSGQNYYGWRSWNLNTSVATTFESFFDGGFRTASPNLISGQAPGNGLVNYYKRITNGSTSSAQSGPAGSLYNKTPNSFENQDLITNAANGFEDGHRVTQVNPGGASGPNAINQGYSRGDNSGAGFGCYYDMTIDGRPESDAQSWDSGTWTNSGGGRFGRDTLENSIGEIQPSSGTRPSGGGWHFWKMWGGKPFSSSPYTGGTGDGGSTYNWNGYTGFDYDFAIYIK